MLLIFLLPLFIFCLFLIKFNFNLSICLYNSKYWYINTVSIKKAAQIINNIGKFTSYDDKLEKSGIYSLLFEILERSQDKITVLNVIRSVGRFISFSSHIIDYICNKLNFLNILLWSKEFTNDYDEESEWDYNVKFEVFDFLYHLVLNFGNVESIEHLLFEDTEIVECVIDTIFDFMNDDRKPESALSSFRLIERILELDEFRSDKGQSSYYLVKMLEKGLEDQIDELSIKFPSISEDILEFATNFKIDQYSDPLQKQDF